MVVVVRRGGGAIEKKRNVSGERFRELGPLPGIKKR